MEKEALKMSLIVELTTIVKKLLIDKEGKEYPYNFRTKYTLVKVFNMLQKEYNIFEKLKNDLIIQYGEKIEENGQEILRVSEEKKEEYFGKLKEVLDMDTTITSDKFHKVVATEKMNFISEIAGFNIPLSSMEITILDVFLFEEEKNG